MVKCDTNDYLSYRIALYGAEMSHNDSFNYNRVT